MNSNIIYFEFFFMSNKILLLSQVLPSLYDLISIHLFYLLSFPLFPIKFCYFHIFTVNIVICISLIDLISIQNSMAKYNIYFTFRISPNKILSLSRSHSQYCHL